MENNEHAWDSLRYCEENLLARDVTIAPGAEVRVSSAYSITEEDLLRARDIIMGEEHEQRAQVPAPDKIRLY